MTICTLYSHFTGFNTIVEILQANFPKTSIQISKQNEFSIAELDIKGGFFSSSSKLKVSYREREQLSYQLFQEDNCPVSRNLKGLYGFADSLPCSNLSVKELFLQKITTINSEFSIILEKGQLKNLGDIIKELSQKFDAFLFVQPNTIISQSAGQHFLDKNLNLIIDTQGNCNINKLEVQIDVKYYDASSVEITDDQKNRRQQSESLCIERNIPIYKNPNSLFVESENTVTLRTQDEVVDRAISLCYVELKSENLEKQHLAAFDKKYNVVSKLSPKEHTFALNDNPSDQDMVEANWRAESYHVLLWALGFIKDLSFPSDLCNIGDDVGILFSKSEQEFREMAKLRSKKEILDQADLILRYNWACVSVRINNQPPPSGLNGSVVFERHYALNWLICSQNQEWDDVTTNT